MPLISDWSFDDPSLGLSSSILVGENQVQVKYPCADSTRCTSLRVLLPSGRYLFELAGGSGYIPNFFVAGERPKDSPLSGGYVSGVLSLNKPTNITLNIGGQGKGNLGGFNGGGSGLGDRNTNGGGGGASDIRIEKNDPFHRIIVAGGGGGSDDQERASLEANDGNGGSGGGLQSQSFFVSSKCISGFESNETSGFSFFQGENGLKSGTKHPLGYKLSSGIAELSGGGGGWFGGFSSHHCNGGSSGGSSFALTRNATVPIGIIPVYDANYVIVQENFYGFNPIYSHFVFENVTHKRGVWNGNGFITITRLSSITKAKCSIPISYHFLLKNNVFIFLMILFSN